MANLFDSLQNRTFDTAGRVFGYDATWEPSDGSPAQAARVLFKDPADDEEILSAAYLRALSYDNVIYPVMEYRRGEFDGLYEAVADRNNYEEVTIGGVKYEVHKIEPVFDGKTYKAHLQRANGN